MDHDELNRHVLTAFKAAMDNDAHAAAEALTAIGTSGDHFHMYAACCGFAEIGKRALAKVYGDRTPDPAKGGMWAMQELQPGALAADPPKTFATRFLIAYCNDDKDTAPALFRAALEAGGTQYVDSVLALLADVAGISRLAFDQTA
jgi:hypothetical protein